MDLTVHAGETFGFPGPNGAGKSTTIAMLCTLARPTAGRASVAGADVTTDPGTVRRRIGLVFQELTVDGHLTAAENLRFHACLYGLPRRTARRRVADTLALVGLHDRRDSLVRTADDTAALDALRQPFGLQAHAAPEGLLVHVPDGAPFVPRLCAGLGVPVLSVAVTRPSLDDVFLRCTGRTLHDADGGR
ncbi:ATP-binding cassette domain-containing protein [Streptomyces nondiastaticus]